MEVGIEGRVAKPSSLPLAHLMDPAIGIRGYVSGDSGIDKSRINMQH